MCTFLPPQYGYVEVYQVESLQVERKILCASFVIGLTPLRTGIHRCSRNYKFPPSTMSVNFQRKQVIITSMAAEFRPSLNTDTDDERPISHGNRGAGEGRKRPKPRHQPKLRPPPLPQIPNRSTRGSNSRPTLGEAASLSSIVPLKPLGSSLTDCHSLCRDAWQVGETMKILLGQETRWGCPNHRLLQSCIRGTAMRKGNYRDQRCSRPAFDGSSLQPPNLRSSTVRWTMHPLAPHAIRSFILDGHARHAPGWWRHVSLIGKTGGKNRLLHPRHLHFHEHPADSGGGGDDPLRRPKL